MTIITAHNLRMTTILAIFLTCVFRCVFTYNFVTSLPLVKIGTPATSFGYSVSFHIQNSQPKILVGAPNGKFNEYQSLLNVPTPGRAYLCDINQDYDCKSALINDLTHDELLNKYQLLMNDSLTGLSVCGSNVDGGPMIVCGPRMRHPKNQYMGTGACLLINNNNAVQYFYGFCVDKDPYFDNHGLCNLGSSCAMAESFPFTSLFGAPGAVTWRGNVERNVEDWSPITIKEYDTQKYSYFGYSVALGTMDGQEVIIGGAPREEYIGMVLLYRYHGEDLEDNHLNLHFKLKGDQFGSYFGASLCLVDINGDGESDLVVGAPLYHEPLIGGAIYVYIKKKGGKELQFNSPQKIKSREMKEVECLKLNCFDARFGWSITSLKDMDYDGYQDIAVGAPFEGNGVIYIFRGSQDGLIPKYSQRIESSQLGTSVKPEPVAFGYSMDSRGVDADGNHYPDLVVGSFMTDNLVVLRTSSIVDVDASFQSLPSIVDPNLTKCPDDGQNRNCFQVRVCLRTGSRQHHLKAARATVNIVVETELYAGAQVSRVTFEGMNSKEGHTLKRQLQLDLNSQDDVCNNYKLYIGTNTRDFLNSVPIRLTYSVDPNFPKYDNNKLLSLDDSTMLKGSVGVKELMVEFKKNCGDDNVCKSKLLLESALLLKKDKNEKDRYKLLVGLDREVVVMVDVMNSLEDAHEANVFIEYPDTIKYIGANETTKHEEQSLVSCGQSPVKGFIVCSIGNPLPSKGKVTFKVRFDPKGLALSIEPLVIKVLVNTTSTDQNLMNNNKTFMIDIKIESDLWVTGNSEPENVFFGGNVVGESAMVMEKDIGLEVKHSYEVKNIGKARVPGCNLIISWPYELQSDLPSGKHILYLLDPPLLDGLGKCEFNHSYVNPLKLKKEAPSLPLRTSETHAAKINQDETYRMRRSIKDDSDIVLDCEKNTAKCLLINCTFEELRPGQSVVVRLRARLWNSTFLTDFKKKKVSIQSKGQITIDNPLVGQSSIANDVFRVVTYAMSDEREEAQVPLWIIIASIIAGILLLALIIFLLWKFGFFRRQRAGNINTHRAVLMKE